MISIELEISTRKLKIFTKELKYLQRNWKYFQGNWNIYKGTENIYKGTEIFTKNWKYLQENWKYLQKVKISHLSFCKTKSLFYLRYLLSNLIFCIWSNVLDSSYQQVPHSWQLTILPWGKLMQNWSQGWKELPKGNQKMIL